MNQKYISRITGTLVGAVMLAANSFNKSMFLNTPKKVRIGYD